MAQVIAKQNKSITSINRGIPAKKDSGSVFLIDYQSMIKEAEKGKGMSFEQYTEKTQEWLQKNL